MIQLIPTFYSLVVIQRYFLVYYRFYRWCVFPSFEVSHLSFPFFWDAVTTPCRQCRCRDMPGRHFPCRLLQLQSIQLTIACVYGEKSIPKLLSREQVTVEFCTDLWQIKYGYENYGYGNMGQLIWMNGANILQWLAGLQKKWIQGEVAPGPAPRQVPGMGSNASWYLWGSKLFLFRVTGPIGDVILLGFWYYMSQTMVAPHLIWNTESNKLPTS